MLKQRNLWFPSLLCGCGVDLHILVYYVWLYHLQSIVSWKFFLTFSQVINLLWMSISLLDTYFYLMYLIYCCMQLLQHSTRYFRIIITIGWFPCFTLMTAQSIPLLEVAFVRCTIMVLLSFIWLRRSGLSVFGSANVRKLLASRALVGYVSLMSFVYW